MRKERKSRYGNETKAQQAVGSALIKRVKIRKEVHCAGEMCIRDRCILCLAAMLTGCGREPEVTETLSLIHI